MVWTLTEVDGNFAENKNPEPEGKLLATMTTELAGEKTKLMHGHQMEVGNIHWYETLDERTQRIALMLVMLLWHRNRQIIQQLPLGPSIRIGDPRFTPERSADRWANEILFRTI